MKFTGIRVLIWDFDGTLYRPNPDLFRAVRESEYRTIMEKTGWDYARAVAEFENLYKKVTPSATQTVAKLSGMTTTEAAQYQEAFFDRRDYLSRDQKLVDLFTGLTSYTQYILANGTVRRIRETLITLGLDPAQFADIVTSERSGENKPSENGYRYILEKTKIPPGNHLMIGDREAVDLAPAKKLGMHTCLVWSETPGTVAEVTLPTVYAVPEVL